VAPNSTIINEYGPTECSVATTVWKCQGNIDGDQVPIGRPLSNKTVYLLDIYGNPVPMGAIGEMHIGGVGVARGYLNRPDLTAERFITDPFSAEPGARMYRTGDLARYLPDGNIVHMGRNDQQVKIRGFRIELGEIETRLAEHPLVSNAAVVALGEGSNKRLIAYVIDLRDVKPDHCVNAVESMLRQQCLIMLSVILGLIYSLKFKCILSNSVLYGSTGLDSPLLLSDAITRVYGSSRICEHGLVPVDP
jgi:acyl-coenzyme A synthetase/AMP-(fatty) acid ligase